MSQRVAEKLKIREGERLLLLNAPASFRKRLGPLPAGARIVAKASEASQLHWFVTTAAQVSGEWMQVRQLLREGMVLWTYYPKGTSGIQSDLSRDKGWEAIRSTGNLQRLSLVSFDETWSASGARLKTAADRKANRTPRVREIFDWIDPDKKIVRVPDDLAAALGDGTETEAFFNTLSFTNRKEYVEWVVTAKRPETRAARVKGSIERLRQGWKNPRNL
jgi:Bacteriocin-protection, YdeI or OmpD-Associated